MQRTTPARWPAQAAVEVVRLGSAGLSATYYSALGFAVSPFAAAGLGVIAFALDYSKGAVLRAATEGRGMIRRLAALAVFAVLFVASMIAVDGVLMQPRAGWSGGRANAISDYDRADAEYRSATAELAKLKDARTEAEVRAAMDRASVPARTFREAMHRVRRRRRSSRLQADPGPARRDGGSDPQGRPRAEGDDVEVEARRHGAASGGGPAGRGDRRGAGALRRQPGADRLPARQRRRLRGRTRRLLWALGSRKAGASSGNASDCCGTCSGERRRRRCRRRRAQRPDTRVVDFTERFRLQNGRAPSGSEIKAEFTELPTSTAYDYATRARSIPGALRVVA